MTAQALAPTVDDVPDSPGPKTCQKRAASCLHEPLDALTWASWGIDYVKVSHTCTHAHRLSFSLHISFFLFVSFSPAPPFLQFPSPTFGSKTIIGFSKLFITSLINVSIFDCLPSIVCIVMALGRQLLRLHQWLVRLL